MPIAVDTVPGHVRAVIAEVVHPAHFFLGLGTSLEWDHAEREEISWEIFQGRLLDASQTRQIRSFESWNMYLRTPEGRSAEPLLAVKLDTEAGRVHVVRAIYSYAWEGYHAGDNVYLSREVRKWLRELVGSIPLDRSAASLRTALAAMLFQAVVGLSRLPLNSVEAPLPCFSLGQLGYFFQPVRAADEPMRGASDLIGRAFTAERPWSEKAKLLEFLIRSTPTDRLADAFQLFVRRCQEIGIPSLPALFRTLFQDVSLSPYTDFVDRTFCVLGEQGHLTGVEHIDFLSWLLRQLGRHLTAYDLVVFHHRGANYPDALLLDRALNDYVALAQLLPAVFAPSPGDDANAAKSKRLRRRALRQAVLLRCRYEGHAVPDTPTSPGENLRVLPGSSGRVPNEQITDPSQRTRQLFAHDPLLPRLNPTVLALLRASIEDLDEPAELRELGTALFLDRPLGIWKRPAEPDQSLLLSYEAFSATIAEERLRLLTEKLALLAEPRGQALRTRLRQNDLARGIPLSARPGPARPGVVALSDALEVAPDFILLRSTRRSVEDFLAQYGTLVGHPDFFAANRPALIVGGTAVDGQRTGTLLLYDEDFRLRLALEIEPTGELRQLRS